MVSGYSKFEAELRIAGIKLDDQHLTELGGEVFGIDISHLSSEEFLRFPFDSSYIYSIQRLILPPLSEPVPDLGQLSDLTCLSMERMDLNEVPESVFHLTHLRCLNIAGNHLSTLPDAFSHLSALQVLNLGGNSFSIFPSPVLHLTKLKCLALGSNQLSLLPQEISELDDLEQLYLYNNQLTDLPATLGSLKRLSLLFIESNHLSKLPSAVMELTQLRYLRFDSRLQPVLTPANFIWLETIQSSGCLINQEVPPAHEREVCYRFSVQPS